MPPNPMLSPTQEPILMMRPPLFLCFSAACVATNIPRTLIAKTRSKFSRLVSTTGSGMHVPALFTSTSSLPNVVTVCSTAPFTASASAASALHLSVAAVSRQLLVLEEGLGVTLITRSTRRLNITESGERWRDHCARVLAAVDAAEADVKAG